ncbi:MAG: hypothetical protein IPL61_25500 [Myxococcales bacterium]|nr:hypothetical protein [Myxococcales bacterium]
MSQEPNAMLSWTPVERAWVGGDEFVLARDGDDWVVRVEQRILMTNRMYASEVALAELSLAQIEEPRSVLIGGLGLGYTLRAVLDLVGDDAAVTVAELVPELVEWNRTHVGVLNDFPLEDPRVEVVIGDVYDTLKRSPGAFDAILLDVDNGPKALSQAKNQRLYSDAGTRVCLTALAPDGILAVWANGHSPRYARKVEALGCEVDVQWVRNTADSRSHSVVYLIRP